MAVPYTFGSATSSIPLSQLDSNFATGITLGNTTVYLGNTTTSFGNVSLTNVTISSVSTAITPAQGGTGLITIPANNVILGNGTSNVAVVAPGTSGNVLTSNGTTWTSATISAASVSAAGSTTQVQYNNAGAFAGSANLTFNGTTLTAAGLAGPFNGTVGATTPNTGSFTTLAASSTVSGTGFSTYLASPPAIGGTAAAAGTFTTTTINTSETLSYGTANGVTYLNGSKVLTSGSALTWDTANLQITNAGGPRIYLNGNSASSTYTIFFNTTSSLPRGYVGYEFANDAMPFAVSGSEQMRLTSTGLGIGTSSPSTRLDVSGDANTVIRINGTATSGLTFAEGGVNKQQIYMDEGNLVFYDLANSAERMRISSAGNLGLGVTPSAWTVYKVLQMNRGSFVSSGTNAFVGSNWFYDGADKYITSDYASFYRQSSGVHTWATAPSGTAGNAISFTQAATLTADGNYVVGATGSNFRIAAIVEGGANRDIFQAAINGYSNGLTVKWNHATSTTRVNITSLPTSATGLASGDLYVLAGALMVA